MNDKAVYRTAPATPGLLNTLLFGANAMLSTGFEEQSVTYLEQSATYLEQNATSAQSVTWGGAE